jgi:hypothetical protein
MAGGGGNDQMLNMGLMIAAGVAAPELAPLLMEGGALGAGLGATAATGITGATLGGLAGAATGQDVARSAAMGGLGGAAAGYFGGVQAAEPGSMLAQGPTAPGAGFNTGAPVQTSIGSTPMDAFKAGSTDVSQFGKQIPMTPADFAEMPANLPSNTALQRLPGAQDIAYGQNSFAGPSGASSVMNPTANAGSAFSKANMIGGGVAGLDAILNAKPSKLSPEAKYAGALSKFKYDPSSYEPAEVPPPPYGYRQMAVGGVTDSGTVEQMSRENAVGGNQMFPQSGIGGLTNANTYQNPTNTPIDSNIVGPTDTVTNHNTGQMAFAGGGLSSLGMYSDGGRLLRGPGDGVSDNIPARIGRKQEARLADGEFVVPARIVSELGNGSTEAGAKRLYKMMDNVQHARKKSIGKDKFAKDTKAYKHLPA